MTARIRFCNAQHAFVHGFCQTANPFVSMPHCVLGIVQVR